MGSKIRDSRPAKKINPSGGARKIDHEEVAAALGAEIIASGPRTNNPITFLALHERISNELQSTGGRPGRVGVYGRRKVPMSDLEWSYLQHVSDIFASLGLNVSPGQVASFLIVSSLEQLRPEIEALEAEEGQILDAAASARRTDLEALQPVAQEMINRMKLEKLKELIPGIKTVKEK